MFRTSTLIVVCLGLLTSFDSNAQRRRGKGGFSPVISVDSNYFLTPRNTNRAIANYALELSTGLSLLKVKALGRGGIYSSFLNFIATYAIAYSTFVMNHEFGHGSRSQVLGHLATYGFSPAGISGIPNVFLFSAVAPIHVGRFAFTETSAPRTDEVFGDIVARGGTNNSAYLAEAMEEHIWFKSGTRHWWVTYFLSKFDAIWYNTFEKLFKFKGDPYSILQDYKQRKIDVGAVDLRAGGLISLFGSFSFWNLYLFGAPDPQKTVYTWELLRFIRLPDISFYMNAGGVSYKASSGISVGRRGGPILFFPVAFEKMHKGRTGEFDVTGGIRFDTNAYLPTGFAIGAHLVGGRTQRGRGLGGRAEAEFRFAGDVNLTFGAEQFDLRTLHGERLTLNYGKNIAREVWGRIGLRY